MMQRLILILLSIIYACLSSFSQKLEVKSNAGTSTEGEFFTRYVYSPGLENNLLGDSPLRDVLIYLPPEYDDSTEKRYPVIYFLHGYIENPGWWGAVDDIMNKLLSQGKISPMIAVCPNSNNKYRGSMYANSSVTGNWEDFIVEDIVNYVDRNFRSLPQPSSRGIAGFSMGGRGSIILAMQYPEVFSSVYSLSSGSLIFKDALLVNGLGSLIAAACADSFDDLVWGVQWMIAQAAAFAPNPSMLFYGELPVTCDGELIDSVWQKWLKHDPYTLLPIYKDNLLNLNAIQFDCGTEDGNLDVNISFSQELTNHGIDHVFETYPGSHFIYDDRLENKVLPFFSTNLADTMLLDTVLHDLISWQYIGVVEHSDSVGIIALDTTLYVRDSIRYSLVAGDPSNVFTVDSLTGEIKADTIKLDYETIDPPKYYDLLIAALYKHDSILIADKGNVLIEVKNIYEPLLTVRDTIFGIEENSPIGTTVGQIPYDNPEGIPLSFTIIDGNINGTFKMDFLGLGKIQIANADSLNYDTNPEFILTVAVEELQGGICRDTVTVTINLTPVSTFDQVDNKIEIYPNPANDIITIQTDIPEQHLIEITSLHGQLLYQSKLAEPLTRIDLSSFQKGVYFITLRSRDYVRTEKIIKL